jgi:hypothetical protein
MRLDLLKTLSISQDKAIEGHYMSKAIDTLEGRLNADINAGKAAIKRCEK